MPTYNKKIVYLSDAQRQELFANGSIVVGGETFTYDPTDIYVTPQGVNMSIGTVSTLPAGSNATAAIRGTVDNPILDLGIPCGTDGTIAVSGTTPSITALTGIRYICGECSTLDVILPASGIVDVTFESGTTPTTLTVTPPTGTTLKWANEFDPDNLEANTIYEINIANGLGVAVSWS